MSKERELPEDIKAKIVAKYENGTAVARIKAQHSVSCSKIYKTISNANCKRRRPNPKISPKLDSIDAVTHTAIARRYQEGVPLKSITEEFNVCNELVRKVVVFCGIERRRKTYKNDIVKMSLANASIEEIVSALGCSKRRVYSVRRACGFETPRKPLPKGGDIPATRRSDDSSIDAGRRA